MVWPGSAHTPKTHKYFSCREVQTDVNTLLGEAGSLSLLGFADTEILPQVTWPTQSGGHPRGVGEAFRRKGTQRASVGDSGRSGLEHVAFLLRGLNPDGGWGVGAGGRGLGGGDVAGTVWFYLCKKHADDYTLTACLFYSFGCSGEQNKTPLFYSTFRTLAALRTKMAFYAPLVSGPAPQEQNDADSVRTNSDPTTKLKTELEKNKVQQYILKCQTYFKGLGFYFSPELCQ